MSSIWTLDDVMKACAILPPIKDDEEFWAKIWTRPVYHFGLMLASTSKKPQTPFKEWPKDWSEEPLVEVPIRDIIWSYQGEGIMLEIVKWYVENDELWDPDGWFNNNHPILVKFGHFYAIKDGNHRTIAAKLKREKTIKAHVMEGKMP